MAENKEKKMLEVLDGEVSEFVIGAFTNLLTYCFTIVKFAKSHALRVEGSIKYPMMPDLPLEYLSEMYQAYNTCLSELRHIYQEFSDYIVELNYTPYEHSTIIAFIDRMFQSLDTMAAGVRHAYAAPLADMEQPIDELRRLILSYAKTAIDSETNSTEDESDSEDLDELSGEREDENEILAALSTEYENGSKTFGSFPTEDESQSEILWPNPTGYENEDEFPDIFSAGPDLEDELFETPVFRAGHIMQMCDGIKGVSEAVNAAMQDKINASENESEKSSPSPADNESGNEEFGRLFTDIEYESNELPDTSDETNKEVKGVDAFVINVGSQRLLFEELAAQTEKLKLRYEEAAKDIVKYLD